MTPTVQFSAKFKREYKRLTPQEKAQWERKFRFFMQSPLHPSLRLKRVKGSRFWEMSVNMSLRVTFEKQKNHFLFRRIGTHEILKHP